MNKKILAILSITVLLLIFILPSAVYAWTATATSYKLKEIGDYWWFNYDFESQSTSYTNVDWPMSVIFYGDNDEIDVVSAKSLLWNNSGNNMYARYYDEGEETFEWDLDSGRKSGSTDWNCWHARIYADVDTEQCTHDSWGYYVIASTHRDYLASSEYGHTNDANEAVCDKAADTLGDGAITDDFFNTGNYEAYREEFGLLADHIWDFDGYAEGVDMTDM